MFDRSDCALCSDARIVMEFFLNSPVILSSFQSIANVNCLVVLFVLHVVQPELHYTSVHNVSYVYLDFVYIR